MVSNTEIFTDNSPISPGPSLTVKTPVQENYSVYLLKYLVSKIELLSSGLVLRNQGARKSEQEVCCGQLSQG